MKQATSFAVAPPLAPTRARSDSKPWYRQFWPWFLIALPLSSVVLSFATLYVATTHADTVVPHEGDDSSFSAPRDPSADTSAAAAILRAKATAAAAAKDRQTP